MLCNWRFKIVYVSQSVDKLKKMVECFLFRIRLGFGDYAKENILPEV